MNTLRNFFTWTLALLDELLSDLSIYATIVVAMLIFIFYEYGDCYITKDVVRTAIWVWGGLFLVKYIVWFATYINDYDEVTYKSRMLTEIEPDNDLDLIEAMRKYFTHLEVNGADVSMDEYWKITASETTNKLKLTFQATNINPGKDIDIVMSRHAFHDLVEMIEMRVLKP